MISIQNLFQQIQKSSQLLELPKKTLKPSSCFNKKLSSMYTQKLTYSCSNEQMQSYNQQYQPEQKELEETFSKYFENTEISNIYAPQQLNSNGISPKKPIKFTPYLENNKFQPKKSNLKPPLQQYYQQPINQTKTNQYKQAQFQLNPSVTETWIQLGQEAQEVCKKEPLLSEYYRDSILRHGNLKEAVEYKLSQIMENEQISQQSWQEVINYAFKSNSDLIDDINSDLKIIKQKDASWKSHIHSFMNLKGFTGLALARIAQSLYRIDKEDWAFIIQQKVSQLYGMDIHPGSYFEGGIFFDHATGTVVGETARIGTGTVLLHNVTLGATGKEKYGEDRHPKLGKNCYIGSNVMILGNITLEDDVKVGAGTVCLKSIPKGKTFVGGSKGRML